MNRSLLVFLIICLVSTQLSAQSLREKKLYKEWNDTLSSELADTNKVCGSKIEASLDEESWKLVPEASKKYNMGTTCSDGCLYALEILCKDDLGKEAVQQQIDKVVCRAFAEPEEKVLYNKETKEVTCLFDATKNNFYTTVKSQLENLL